MNETRVVTKQELKVNNVISEKMLAVMATPEAKANGLTLKIEMKDGSKRSGLYLDLVSDPLNRYDYRLVPFIVFKTSKIKGEKDLTVYLPISLIATIEWAL